METEDEQRLVVDLGVRVVQGHLYASAQFNGRKHLSVASRFLTG